MNRIRETRKQAGIKQADLCARLGISQGALSGWETGRYEPGLAGWLSLSEALGVSVDFLMGSNFAAPAVSSELPSQDVEFLRKFHALDPMAQARIMNALNFEYQSAGAVQEDGAKSSRFA